jgi:hypothetical protein
MCGIYLRLVTQSHLGGVVAEDLICFMAWFMLLNMLGVRWLQIMLPVQSRLILSGKLILESTSQIYIDYLNEAKRSFLSLARGLYSVTESYQPRVWRRMYLARVVIASTLLILSVR